MRIIIYIFKNFTIFNNVNLIPGGGGVGAAHALRRRADGADGGAAAHARLGAGIVGGLASLSEAGGGGGGGGRRLSEQEEEEAVVREWRRRFVLQVEARRPALLPKV